MYWNSLPLIVLFWWNNSSNSTNLISYCGEFGFIKGAKNYSPLGPLYYILEDIENLGDQFKYLCMHLHRIGGKKRISQEIYDLVVSTKDYFCELEDVLIVFDGSQNPTGINKYMVQFAKDNGDSIYQTKKSGSDTIDIFDKYIPYNPDQYVIIIIDHIALMKKERGFSIKENIDKMSEYLIGLRNRYNFIPVVVQQLSRSISTTDRFKLDKVEPQLSDFKDTSNTQQDANVVMGLFSPRRYEIGNFRGYDITRLKDRFRSLTVLKNRDGVADLRIGLQFIGEVGQFSEIPKAIEFEGNPDLYEEVINLKYKQKK